ATEFPLGLEAFRHANKVRRCYSFLSNPSQKSQTCQNRCGTPQLYLSETGKRWELCRKGRHHWYSARCKRLPRLKESPNSLSCQNWKMTTCIDRQPLPSLAQS